MKRVKNQRGIGLVEVAIVLAISSLLAVVVISGRGALSRQTAFNSAIDQIRNRIAQVQNESLSSVKSANVGSGSSAQNVFGKLIEFDSTDNNTRRNMNVYTLIASDNINDTALRACDLERVQIPNNLEFLGGANQAMVFANINNQVKTFVAPMPYTFAPSSDCAAIGGTPAPRDDENDGDLPPPPQCFDTIDNDSDGRTDFNPVPGLRDPDCINYADDNEYPPPQCDNGLDDDGDARVDMADGGCTGPNDNDETGGIPGGLCNLAGYTCGLIGEYFRGTKQDNSGTRLPMSRYRETLGMGTALSGTGSAWPNFIPTLRVRTAQNIAQYASVKWTGYINLAEGVHNLCTNSDDGSYLKVDIVGDGTFDFGDQLFNDYTLGHPPTETCRSLTITTGRGGWRLIELGTNNNWREGEGGAAFRFYRQGQTTDFPVADLRSLTSISTFAAPSLPTGLTGRYWKDGNIFDGYQNYQGSFTDNDIGSSVMFPMWNRAYLNTRGINGYSAASPPVWGDPFYAYWTGFIHIPSPQRYKFCLESDDSSSLNIAGIDIAYDYHDHGTERVCTSDINADFAQSPWYNFVQAGQYSIVASNRNGGGPAAFRILYEEWSQQGVFKEVPDEWLSTTAYHYGGDVAIAPVIQNVASAETKILNYLNKFAPSIYASAPRNCSATCNLLDSSNYTNTNNDFQSNGDGADFRFGSPLDTDTGTIIIDTASGTIGRRIN